MTLIIQSLIADRIRELRSLLGDVERQSESYRFGDALITVNENILFTQQELSSLLRQARQDQLSTRARPPV